MADQSPMILAQAKTTDDVDFNHGIKSTIANVYGEDPSNYSDPVAALNRYRQDATRGATTDATGRDLLQSYYGQLEMLELRFPELRVMFNWSVLRRDVFTAQEISQHSLAYEKASILFNLAATYSVLGSSSNRTDPEGIKKAFYNTRVAAGLWDYIANNFLHAPSTDLSRDVVRFLSALMLAQAQEIFLEKTIEEKTRNGNVDGKSMGIVAKLASQCSFQYNALIEPVRENVNKGIFDRHWASVIHVGESYMTSFSTDYLPRLKPNTFRLKVSTLLHLSESDLIAQYFRAMVDKAAGKHGESIARINLAESLAKEAYRLGATFNTFFAPCDTLPADVSSILTTLCKSHQTKCAEYKDEIVKENDLIFHEPIPAENVLAVVEKLNAANAVTITDIYQNPEVQRSIGADLFASLVPFSVHEAASIYSEEKAKIIRSVTEKVEIADTELEAAIEYLGLPGSLRKFVSPSNNINYDISSEVKELSRVIETQEASGGLTKKLSSIASKRDQITSDLQWISNELDIESKECEQARMKYPDFSQSPSARHTKEWRQQLKAHNSGLEKAGSSDASIKQVYQYIDDDVRLLADSAADIEDDDSELALVVRDYVLHQRPSHSRQESLLDVDVGVEESTEVESQQMQAHAREIARLLELLKGLKKQRSQHIQVLRQKIQNDDVSHLLILNRKAQQVESDMFGSELEKFKDDQKMIDNSISEQLKRLEELNGSWLRLTSTTRAKDIHNKHSESDRRRKEILKKFKKAGDTYFEAADGVNRATVFYDDLEQVVNQLKKDVGSFVNKRAKERVQAIVDAEAGSRNSGGIASSFESEFGRINLQTPHRPPKPGVSPPPATSPSPSSYAYGGLPPPPAQPQPSIYQSLYGQQTQAPPQMQPPPPKPSSPQYVGPGYSAPPQSPPYPQQTPSPYNVPQPPNPSQSHMLYQQSQSPYGPSQNAYQMPPQTYQQPSQQQPQQQYYQQPPAPPQNYPYYR
ncbi:BRO1-domain-containing protein [Wallemia mellicola]|uniref:BRO domain-containing protein 1 n=1 Tax=Wallemia mellicola TaxID=1708541 RepID=A0A4T0PHX6_9BASI|nr:BRO1-domain-containing protein [Wallemia mellicola]TIC08887.1 BRO1-domain-containing protein [Wallemia mellicola]TIC09209.1 BRO1-domain-containing protein [Wallemia mellicola]TIC25633.1 BRO1-domain-containing protein [Wallemia mellicola]TIC47859.1 BRO1-domain-containing protein [Wallemia mellicola]